MKKINIFILSLLISVSSYAAIPWSIPNNDMEFGDGTTAPKSYEMLMGLGASNPIFSSANGTEMNVNIPFRVQGALNVEGAVNGVAGTFTGNILTVGDGAASDKDILVNRGGSNPFIRWDESESAWVFSNDGAADAKLGSGGLPDVNRLTGLGLNASVATSALTIDLTQSDGTTDPTGGNPVSISFRSVTLTNGGFNERVVSAALTLVIPSGATLGTINAVKSRLYIYALDNAGTVELAIGNNRISASEKVISTTILNTSSDAADIIYSTTARSNVPVRIIGVIENTQATAGTWDTSPSLVAAGDYVREVTKACNIDNSGTQTTKGTMCEDWVSGFTDGAAGHFIINFITGIWREIPSCTCIGTDNTTCATDPAITLTTFPLATRNTSSTSLDVDVSVVCVGLR